MTATDFDAHVAQLTQKLAEARRAQARADHEVDAAQAAKESAQAKLEANFGVTTVDQARAKLAELEQHLADTITALTTELSAMEGAG